MPINKQIVIFDFCETLVDFQTADAFVDYVRNNLKLDIINRRESIGKWIRSLRIVGYADALVFHQSILKRLKLWQLKGIPEKKMKELAAGYYNQQIKPHLIGDTLELLKKHQKEGCQIWLVSGGYGIYLNYFSQDYGIDQTISSDLEFRKGISTGKMKGLDCMRNSKVKLLYKNLTNTIDDYRIVASYSDSKTDVPILNVAEQGIVVSRKPQSWVKKTKYKEIIWK